MIFWKYKAFNDQKTIVEDVAKCPTFAQLAFTLRQKGLQIIEATSIQPFEYHAELRLKALKMRVQQSVPDIEQQPQPEPETKRNNWSIRRLVERITSLFHRR